ncbi:VWA domain-containing protein [bacterium]|nr:VWA domain-containing protein [bacterium]
MKIKYLIIPLALALSGTVLAATFKVSPSGSVKTQSGVPTNSYYNNYYAKNYVENQTVQTGSIKNIELVMDFSGSMSAWVKEAKSTMSKIIAQIPPQTNVGFRVFGQTINREDTVSRQASVSGIQKKGSTFVVKTETPENLNGACSATKQVSKILPVDYNNLISGMNSVALGGATPMVLALQKTVYNDFAQIPTSEPKKIVLITDGGENCGGDPCAFARQLNRNDIQIDVVLVSSNSRELICLARETGGNFYTLDNVSDLSKTLTRSMTIKNEPQTHQSYEFISD